MKVKEEYKPTLDINKWKWNWLGLGLGTAIGIILLLLGQATGQAFTPLELAEIQAGAVVGTAILTYIITNGKWRAIPYAWMALAVVFFVTGNLYYPSTANMIYALAGIMVILGELIYWLYDKAKPNRGDSTFWLAAERKLLSYVKALITALTLIGIQRRVLYFLPFAPSIAQAVGLIIAGYIIIKINELKYHE